MEEFRTGALFAGHRIEGVAGRGGMGIVYRAWDLRLERLVALKVISPQLAERPEQRARFVSESRTAAALDHPGIVPVFYAGEEDGTAFIAMRFIEGSDLRSLVRDAGRLEPERAAGILEQVAAALDAAHARGLVHRDVKPGNILIGPGDRAYLTDFGLSKRVDGASRATRSGEWVGTLAYVAPEMIRGRPVDHRADVYALGGVLFHMVTGQAPYRRDRDEAVLWAHVHEPPPRPRDVVPDLPPGLDDVVARAMAKDPADRYASTGDLAGAARAALGWIDASTASGTRSAVTPVMRIEPPPRSRPRRRLLPLAAVLPLLAGAAVVTALLNDGGSERRAAAKTPAAAVRTASKPHVAVTVPVGERPNDLVLTPKRLWVTSAHARTLAALDPRTARLAANVGGFEDGLAGVTSAFGTQWVTNEVTGTLVALDPHRHRPAHVLAMPPRPQVVRGGLGALWVLTRGDPAMLVKVDPRTFREVDRRALPGAQSGDLAIGHGAVYVTNTLGNRLLRIHPQRLTITRTVLPGLHPRGVAVGQGHVWVALGASDTVARYSYDLAHRRTIPVGRRPYAITAGRAGVWVANFVGGTVMRIDPRRARVQGPPVRVGRGPYRMAATAHRLWVTLVGDNAVARVDVP